MFHSRDGLLWLMCCVGFGPNVTFSISAKMFHLGFVRPQNVLSHIFKISTVFLHTSNGTPDGLFELWIPSCHTIVQAKLVECLGYCCHMHIVNSLCHKGLYLFQSCHSPRGGLSDQSPPDLVTQFGGTA